MLYHKVFSITKATKDLDMLVKKNRVWNYQKMTMCNFIYYRMFKYIFFVMIVFVCFAECELRICTFTWNMIACFFLWMWSCFPNFSCCVKRPFTYAWNCFQKRYRGPSLIITISHKSTRKTSFENELLIVIFNYHN